MSKSTISFLKRFFSLSISTLLILTTVPVKSAFTTESKKFATSAKANHWGRSDLRAYLNGVKKENETLPIDTTNHARKSSNYYESNFSDKEYAIVKPFTYETSVLDDSQNEISTYKTTDKFWLPSGNANNGIISWGSNDISSNEQYTKTITNDKQHIIPNPYWSGSWLRSPDYSNAAKALCAKQGTSVITDDITKKNAFASALKIDLSSILFASVASAKNIIDDSLTDNANSNAKKIEISKFEGPGAPSVDYGMYLKTESNSSFSPSNISLSNNKLTINYSDDVEDQYVEGQYIVVHVFRADTLSEGTTNYVAAQKIEPNQNSAEINVENWGLNNFDGYTVKVWMEDGSGSLASATEPQSFPSDNSDQPSINPRVFALTSDLQTSWGTLNNATDPKGDYLTNQKIYFGNMAFWIAGRETAVNNSTVDPEGNIMTLYQAKPMADSQKEFNASANNYKEISNTSLWGTPEEHGKITHYVNSEGITSVEVTEDEIIWLREESWDPKLERNTSAWYGLDNTSGIFKKGSRFYVQWLNEKEHPEEFKNIDKEIRTEVEDDKGWLFNIGVIAPDGTPYKQLEEPVDIYVQIGDDWDKDELKSFYITLENDEEVPVRYEVTTYPEGTAGFGIITVSHFSPYFIYDKLLNKEEAPSNSTPKELSPQQNEEHDEISPSSVTKTGDEITYFAILGLGLAIILALTLILNPKINRKKLGK